MEPKEAAQHYSETLVTLPGLGLCLPRSPAPASRPQRATFGLDEDDIVYLCTQSPFKFLPKYDHVFPSIAEQVPGSRFVFVEGEYPAWTTMLRTRLNRAFERKRLDPEDHIVFVPVLAYERYLELNVVSDVFLDPIGWSGGLTAVDSLSCALPMVILPGQFMRGRQTLGMLSQIALKQTIASTVDEYVEIDSLVETALIFGLTARELALHL